MLRLTLSTKILKACYLSSTVKTTRSSSLFLQEQFAPGSSGLLSVVLSLVWRKPAKSFLYCWKRNCMDTRLLINPKGEVNLHCAKAIFVHQVENQLFETQLLVYGPSQATMNTSPARAKFFCKLGREQCKMLGNHFD